jgi:SAM-dependent methyltransferase
VTAANTDPVYDVARGAYMRARRAASSVLLDRRLGIETSREVDLATLGLAGTHRVDYEPSGWLGTRRALGRHPIHPDDVFLDLGSGKGRVVLEAARRPFRRVMGVELSPQLTAIAARNVDACRPRLRCQDVQLVTADVTTFRVPDDVTVVYMCNPFGGPVFQAAVDALIASVDRRPRRLRLSHWIAREDDRLMATGRFRPLGGSTSWRPTREWSQRAALHEYELLPPPEADRRNGGSLL